MPALTEIKWHFKIVKYLQMKNLNKWVFSPCVQPLNLSLVCHIDS